MAFLHQYHDNDTKNRIHIGLGGPVFFFFNAGIGPLYMVEFLCES